MKKAVLIALTVVCSTFTAQADNWQPSALTTHFNYLYENDICSSKSEFYKQVRAYEKDHRTFAANIVIGFETLSDENEIQQKISLVELQIAKAARFVECDSQRIMPMILELDKFQQRLLVKSANLAFAKLNLK